MEVTTFSKFLKRRFPFPVKKISLHTFFGCPHRENRTGKGGCLYCNNTSFSSIDKAEAASITEQLSLSIDTYRKRGFSGKFIAYFQTYTNTYAPFDEIVSMIEQALLFKDDVIGVSVSTRPDCISNELLDFFDDIGKRYMFWLELGLQTSHDRTLKLINRGHDFACFRDAMARAKKRKSLLLCTHLILGLPGEDRYDMAETITRVKKLGSHGVKLHHLQIVRDTEFETWYNEGRISVLDWREYLDLLLYLAPYIGRDLIVHRWMGDADNDILIAPKWEITKQRFLSLFYEQLSML